VGRNPVSLTVVNFNGDGLADLIVTLAAEDGLLLLSKGNGDFELAIRIPGLAGSRAIAAGDFNQDGILDLAFSSGSSGAGVRVLMGKAGGSFQPGASYDFEGFPGRP